MKEVKMNQEDRVLYTRIVELTVARFKEDPAYSPLAVVMAALAAVATGHHSALAKASTDKLNTYADELFYGLTHTLNKWGEKVRKDAAA